MDCSIVKLHLHRVVQSSVEGDQGKERIHMPVPKAMTEHNIK